jgi:hypothetical protein
VFLFAIVITPYVPAFRRKPPARFILKLSIVLGITS